MRKGFKITFQKNTYAYINEKKMGINILKRQCFINFDGLNCVLNHNQGRVINERLEIHFISNKSHSRRGSITFFADKSVMVFREGHPSLNSNHGNN